jgi:hypothetical protein
MGRGRNGANRKGRVVAAQATAMIGGVQTNNLTVAQVKDILPSVPVNIGTEANPYVIQAQVTGRRMPFATIVYRPDQATTNRADWVRQEVAWETITNVINRRGYIRL